MGGVWRGEGREEQNQKHTSHSHLALISPSPTPLPSHSSPRSTGPPAWPACAACRSFCGARTPWQRWSGTLRRRRRRMRRSAGASGRRPERMTREKNPTPFSPSPSPPVRVREQTPQQMKASTQSGGPPRAQASLPPPSCVPVVAPLFPAFFPARPPPFFFFLSAPVRARLVCVCALVVCPCFSLPSPPACARAHAMAAPGDACAVLLPPPL